VTAVTTVTTEGNGTTEIGGAGTAGAASTSPNDGWGPPERSAARVPPALAVGRDALRQPGELEAAVIAAAVEALWPRPVVVAPAPERHGAWRFSGRWWARPSTARRPRPWR
jgi:hypothetical protein